MKSEQTLAGKPRGLYNGTAEAVTNVSDGTLRSNSKVVIAGAVGSIVEYFDFGIYGYVATILAGQFFVKGDPTAALLSTLATFAVAFFLRPLGGIMFSHYGDRYGRKSVLAATVILMSIASGLIGILPTYASLGVGATALLVLARCLQGIAAGGESGGAIAMVAEFSPPSRRGFLCSTSNMGGLSGILLASVFVSMLNQFLTPEDMAAWGWRIPFLVAIPLGTIGLWIRSKLSEAPAFEEASREGVITESPFKMLITKHWRPLLQAIGLAMLLQSLYYVTFVYVNIHFQRVVGLSPKVAFWSTSVNVGIAVLLMPLFGKLSDRIGRKPIFVVGSLLAIIIAVPCFAMMNKGPQIAISMQLLMSLCESALMGTAFATLAELFPTRVRYTGVALAYNIGGVTAGGSAPFVCAWLVATTGSASAPAYFVIGTGLLTLIAALTLRETAGSTLRA